MSFFGERRANTTLVVGVVVSAALVIIPTVIRTEFVTLGLMIGLHGVSITLMIEVITRLERREHLTHRAFRLIEALDRAPAMIDDIEQGVTTAAAVSRSGLPLYREAVEQAAAEFRLKVDQLHRGEYRVQTGSAALLISQTKSTKSSMKATSIVTINENWWHSQAGTEYWEENLRALKRGVQITRIYILDGQCSRRMTELMSVQAEAGIRVYAIDRDLIPAELYIDVVIFDERGVYEIEPSTDDRQTRRTFKISPVDVRAISLRFEQILQVIMQYDSSAAD